MVNKSGFIAGILSLIILVVAEIPIYPPKFVIKFSIFSYNEISFYVWGYVLASFESYSFLSLSFPENIISLLLWLILCFLTITCIFASIKKSNLSNSIKLYSLNEVLVSILLVIYALQFIFVYITELELLFLNIGVGYYLMVIILILDVMAKKNLKKKE